MSTARPAPARIPSRALTLLVAVAGLTSAIAAIALPASAQTSEIAAILSVGALALLAGHGWGLPVVTLVEVILLGRLWPLVVYDWPPAPEVQIVVYTALAGALPGLFLLRRTLPRAIDLLLGTECPPRLHAAAVALAAALSGLALILPVWRIAF